MTWNPSSPATTSPRRRSKAPSSAISNLTGTETGDDKKSIDTFAVVADTPGLDAAVERGRVLAEAQNFARDLVNEPANRLTPLAMADAARKMAAEFGLECEVLDREPWRNSAWARCWAWPSAAPNRPC